MDGLVMSITVLMIIMMKGKITDFQINSRICSLLKQKLFFKF